MSSAPGTFTALRLVVWDSRTGARHDMSQQVSNAEIFSSMLDQPGSLRVELVDDGRRLFDEGSRVRLWVDGKLRFDGFVFEKGVASRDHLTLFAYDRTRYLMNQTTFISNRLTLSQIFTRICRSVGMPHKIVDGSTVKLKRKVFDNDTCWSVLQWAIDQRLRRTGRLYCVYDSGTRIVLRDVGKMATKLVLADESLITDWEYTGSIDQSTYNAVRVVKAKSKKSKRQVVTVRSKANIRKWGLLQMVESADSESTRAQMRTQANRLLKLNNRRTRTLRVVALGDFRLRAYKGVGIMIKRLKAEGVPYKRIVLVQSCTHRLEGGMHTMDLDLAVV